VRVDGVCATGSLLVGLDLCSKFSFKEPGTLGAMSACSAWFTRKVFVCPVMERGRGELGFNSHAPESARRFQRVDVLVGLEYGDW
jgi:hypothetical protein